MEGKILLLKIPQQVPRGSTFSKTPPWKCQKVLEGGSVRKCCDTLEAFVWCAQHFLEILKTKFTQKESFCQTQNKHKMFWENFFNAKISVWRTLITDDTYSWTLRETFLRPLHASVQKVPKANVCLNSRRCKILACRYHYRKAWYLIDLWWCW